MKKNLRKIYRLLPFKKQLFQAVRFFWSPPHSVYKHLHFTGIINVRVDETTSFKMKHYAKEIENDVFWKGLTGGWEKISIHYWMILCRQAGVIIDIGANTGLYALTAKALNLSANVYAFEPLKQMFDKLIFNNQLNQFDIASVEKAVSDTNGSAVIYETGTDHVAAATLNAAIRQPDILTKETLIETITLDTFILENNIRKIDLIKIDVETHEPNVLEGYKQFLPLHRPDFLIEVLTVEVAAKLQRQFEGLGYCYFNIDDKRGTVTKTDTICKSDHFNYLVCKKETAQQLQLV